VKRRAEPPPPPPPPPPSPPLVRKEVLRVLRRGRGAPNRNRSENARKVLARKICKHCGAKYIKHSR